MSATNAQSASKAQPVAHAQKDGQRHGAVSVRRIANPRVSASSSRLSEVLPMRRLREGLSRNPACPNRPGSHTCAATASAVGLLQGPVVILMLIVERGCVKQRSCRFNRFRRKGDDAAFMPRRLGSCSIRILDAAVPCVLHDWQVPHQTSLRRSTRPLLQASSAAQRAHPPCTCSASPPPEMFARTGVFPAHISTGTGLFSARINLRADWAHPRPASAL